LYRWNPLRKLRVKLNQYLIGAVCIITAVFICNIVRHLNNLYIVDNYENEALNKKTVYFAVKSYPFMNMEFLLGESIVENATLLLHAKGTGLYYEVIFSSGKNDIFQGKFFSKEDFISGKRSAVVGSATSYDNNHVYIKEKDYTVKGAMAESINKALNYSVFFTEGRLDKVPATSVFAIASQNKKDIKKTLERISKALEDRGMELQVIDYRKTQYADFIDYHQQLIILLAGLGVILFLMNIISIAFWLMGKRGKERVWFLFGYSHIKLRLGLEYIRTLIVSLFIGIAVYSLVWGKDSNVIQNIMISSMITIFMEMASLLIVLVAHKSWEE
jgi:hypothetical protein